jgi:hypothetical protein
VLVVALAGCASNSEKPAAVSELVDFDNGKALEKIYGNYSAKEQQALWKPERERLGDVDQPSGFAEYKSRVILIKAFEQGGLSKCFVVTESAPANGSCAECQALIGGAIFVRRNDKWETEVVERYITSFGHFGAFSKSELTSIGAENYGALLRVHESAFDKMEELMLLVAAYNGKFTSLTLDRINGDNAAVCRTQTRPAGTMECYRYDSSYQFIAGANGQFNDLKVQTTGTVASGSEIKKIDEVRLFRFQDGRYQLSR